MTIHRLLTFFGAGILLLAAACTTPPDNRAERPSAMDSGGGAAAPMARNIILFVGDGMGVSTVTAIRILDGQRKGMRGEENILPFERFPHVALSKTYEVNQQVAESAGTATALMGGQKTRAGLIGVGAGAVRGDCASSVGHHLPTILEIAESAGKSTGIVTTTRLSHATPAASYAHVPERDWENDADLTEEARQNGCRDIASQLIDFPYGNGIEVALGGGRLNFLPSGIEDPEGADNNEGRKDGRNLASEWLEKYPNAAYIWNKQQFDLVNPASTDHLLGLFNSDHMQFETDRADDPAGEPSLAQMTHKAIEILERNTDGYFLLVEGGRIDHAHHDGNAYRALTDGIAFAEAVAVADSMTDPADTLIIVTADHSHTFTMGGYSTRGNPILGKVITNNTRGHVNDLYEKAGDNKPFTTLGYHSGPGGAWVGGPRPDLTDVEPQDDKNFVQQAGLPAEDESHGGEDVPVYARGPGAGGIHGVMQQHEIVGVMKAASGLPDKLPAAGDDDQ